MVTRGPSSGIHNRASVRLENVDSSHLEQFLKWYEIDSAENLRRFVERPDSETEQWIKEHPDETSRWAAIHEGQMVGYLEVYYWGEELDQVNASIKIAVKPGLEGQGFGFSLLNTFLQEKAHQLQVIQANIDETNTASINLFQRFGFERVEPWSSCTAFRLFQDPSARAQLDAATQRA